MKMKVRCIGYKDTERDFTIGKIYTWKDNSLKCDNDYVFTDVVAGTDINKWFLSNYYEFEKVESNKVKDEEIWDMLSPKMEKNGIKHDCFKSVSNADFQNLTAFNIPLYSKEMLIKAVSLAYQVGYFRAEKGRPFKYGDKNSPKSDKFVTNKNGKKVYYCDDEIKIGDKVVFILGQDFTDVWPRTGTIGIVKEFSETQIVDNVEKAVLVNWYDERGGTRHNWPGYCKKVVE